MADRNPYVGPYAFEERDADFFFGRARESQILPSMVMSERVTLFFAQSGAGKTSLLNARLVPALKAEGFDVLPVTRVSGELPSGLAPDNLYAFNTVWSLTGSQEDPRALRSLSLDEYLRFDGFEDEATAPRRVLILDQFEEVLTTHPDRWKEREDFFLQLRQSLLDDPMLSMVLVMREDHVAGIERYSSYLPGQLRPRFRMERLRREGAIEAVRRPAEAGGRPFDDGVAEQLVENLCQIRIAGQEETVSGEFVEPVQLQVVCLKLWEKLRERPPEKITFADLDQFGKVDEALELFYEDAVAAAVRETGVSERRIRTWCGTTLITPSHIRGQVSREPAQSGGLPNEAVDRLVKAHLIRPEEARGGTWYELAHDRFIEPILRSNEAWQRSRETPLTAATRAWIEADRNPLFLYRGRRLAAVRALAKANPEAISATEQEFLTRSQAEDVLYQRRRALVVLAFLVAIGLAFLAFWQSRLSASRELAVAAILQRETDPDLGLLLALESLSKAKTPEAEIALHETLNASRVRKAGQIDFNFARTFAFSPDKKHVAAAGDYGRVGVWDTRGKPLFTLPGENAGGDPAALAVTGLAFDPSGRRLAVGDGQGHVVLRDAGTGREVRHWDIHKQVNGLAFAPDGSRLAVASDWPTVSILEIDGTAQPLILRDGHRGRVWGVAFSPDGRRLATVGADGRIFLWDSHSGSRLQELPKQAEAVTRVAFSPDGTKLATAGQNRNAQLWDLAKGSIEKLFFGHSDWIWDVAFSRNGRYLATGSKDLTARIWEVRSGDMIEMLPPGNAEIVNVAFGGESEEFLTASQPLPGETTGVVTRWKVILGDDVTTLTGDTTGFYSVDFSPDGRRIATVDGRHRDLKIWSREGKRLGFAAGERVRDLAFAPHEQDLLATAHSDGKIRLWNVSTRIQRGPVFPGPRIAANAVAFSPDRKLLAAAWKDGSVRLLDHALRLVRGFRAGHAEVFDVAFSPDGDSLATASADGVVRVWDLTSRLPIFELLRAPSVRHLAFHPAGTLLATASVDGWVRLWDVRAPRLVDKRKRHDGQVYGIAFNPDGTGLATCGEKSLVRLWKTTPKMLRELFTLQGHHEQPVYSLAFSPDGKFLATAGADGIVRLEPLASEDVQEQARRRVQGRELTTDERWNYLQE